MSVNTGENEQGLRAIIDIARMTKIMKQELNVLNYEARDGFK